MKSSPKKATKAKRTLPAPKKRIAPAKSGEVKPVTLKKAASKRAAPPSDSVNEVLSQLESLGNEKVRAMYAKNGASQNQYGVKLGDIRSLAKSLKADHEFALRLWETGNVEARLLAVLMIDPTKLTPEQLETMVKSETFVQVADWLHSYVIKEHPDKEALRRKWMESSDRMCARAGWRLTAGRVAKKSEGLDVIALLNRIDTEMQNAVSEVQWTMNNCLAEIGIHFPKHRKRAIAIGERIGLYRDYPVSKGCTSPFAPIWIHAMVERQR
jgi:3-methyladenine DNA glycosylase AlkD